MSAIDVVVEDVLGVLLLDEEAGDDCEPVLLAGSVTVGSLVPVQPARRTATATAKTANAVLDLIFSAPIAGPVLSLVLLYAVIALLARLQVQGCEYALPLSRLRRAERDPYSHHCFFCRAPAVPQAHQ